MQHLHPRSQTYPPTMSSLVSSFLSNIAHQSIIHGQADRLRPNLHQLTEHRPWIFSLSTVKHPTSKCQKINHHASLPLSVSNSQLKILWLFLMIGFIITVNFSWWLLILNRAMTAFQRMTFLFLELEDASASTHHPFLTNTNALQSSNNTYNGTLLPY